MRARAQGFSGEVDRRAFGRVGQCAIQSPRKLVIRACKQDVNRLQAQTFIAIDLLVQHVTVKRALLIGRLKREQGLHRRRNLALAKLLQQAIDHRRLAFILQTTREHHESAVIAGGTKSSRGREAHILVLVAKQRAQAVETRVVDSDPTEHCTEGLNRRLSNLNGQILARC